MRNDDDEVDTGTEQPDHGSDDQVPLTQVKAKKALTDEQKAAKNAAARAKRAARTAETKTAKPAEKEGDEVSNAKRKTATRKAKKAAAKGKTNGAHPRGEKTLAIGRLLQRKTGCTAAEVKELTGWPAVSMPAMSKACGLKLRKEKTKGSPTRYFGS